MQKYQFRQKWCENIQEFAFFVTAEVTSGEKQCEKQEECHRSALPATRKQCTRTLKNRNRIIVCQIKKINIVNFATLSSRN